MKVFIVILCALSYCFAAEYQYNARTYGKDNVESLNERVMERLRQEVGSERGIYHVYLPDGRLQRVQYTAAPLGQQQQAKESTRDQQQYTGFQKVDPRGIYYVQVPEERLQALQAYQPTGYNQQVSQQSQKYEQYSPKSSGEKAQYTQGTPETDSQYLPITVVTTEQLLQSRELVGRNQEQQASFSNQDQRLAKKEQGSQEQSQGYVASIQYSQVEPITGPVYSYSPKPLVRVLRYAPYYL